VSSRSRPSPVSAATLDGAHLVRNPVTFLSSVPSHEICVIESSAADRSDATGGLWQARQPSMTPRSSAGAGTEPWLGEFGVLVPESAKD
jgi:hypothetical protein